MENCKIKSVPKTAKYPSMEYSASSKGVRNRLRFSTIHRRATWPRFLSCIDTLRELIRYAAVRGHPGEAVDALAFFPSRERSKSTRLTLGTKQLRPGGLLTTEGVANCLRRPAYTAPASRGENRVGVRDVRKRAGPAAFEVALFPGGCPTLPNQSLAHSENGAPRKAEFHSSEAADFFAGGAASAAQSRQGLGLSDAWLCSAFFSGSKQAASRRLISASSRSYCAICSLEM